MTVTDLRNEALRDACEGAVLEVLETMFFELPASKAVIVARPAEAAKVSTARFSGSVSGALCVAVSHEYPRRLAAEFLGMDEQDIGPTQEQGIVMELANVLCGATMSRVEPAGRLRIDQPALGDTPVDSPGPWLKFPLECGSLDVTVYYGDPK